MSSTFWQSQCSCKPARTPCMSYTKTTHPLNQLKFGNMKDPFKNRIQELNMWDATDELTQVDFAMGHEAALTWDLPASYVCVVRAIKSDGKIEERSYRQAKAAKTYMKNLLINDCDYVVMTGNAILDTLHDLL